MMVGGIQQGLNSISTIIPGCNQVTAANLEGHLISPSQLPAYGQLNIRTDGFLSLSFTKNNLSLSGLL